MFNHTFITRMLAEHFILSEQSMLKAEILVVRYIFGLCKIKEFAATIRELTGTTSLDFRRHLNSSGYLIRNVKLYLHQCNSLPIHSSVLEPLTKDFQLHEGDWRIARVFKCAEFKSEFSAFDSCYPMSIKEFDALVTHCISQLTVYTAKYVHKKLRFIYSSENCDPEDFIIELLADAIAGICDQYPVYHSTLHATNVCKRIIKNRGNNIIDHYTSKGANTLVRGKDGTFTSLKVSFDVLLDSIYNNGAEESSIFGAASLHREETKMSVQHYVKSLGNKQKKVIHLLSHYNREFTTWLHRNGYVEDLDNEQYLDNCVKRSKLVNYLEAVSEYLDVPPTKVKNFIQHIRKDLREAA